MLGRDSERGDCARCDECPAVNGTASQSRECAIEESSQAVDEKWRALQRGFEARDAIALEVMREVFARLPYGQEFRLSDGSVARLEKLAEPELCRTEHSENYERPCFGVDVVIEGGTLDHVEIFAFQTGWGMAINPPAADREPGKRVSRGPSRGI
jgi:hypothetical protein